MTQKDAAPSAFKQCPNCGATWHTRQRFLDDPAVDLVGYQVNFEQLELGLFLFNHLECRSTMAVWAQAFRDLYSGPVYLQRLTGSDTCPAYCLRQDELDPCPAVCECAWVRELLQVIRRWPTSRPEQ